MQAPELPPGPPVLLAVDGNSLLHRAYHANPAGLDDGFGPPTVDPAGRPIWAVRGLFLLLARVAARVRPDAVLVGFDCPVSSARRDDFPGYKGQRPAKPEPLVEQLLRAPDVLTAAGVPVLVPPGYEADDVLASAAATARAAGWRTVAVTSDRDSFALIDPVTSVLRIRNGGLEEATLVTAGNLVPQFGVPARLYRDYAAIRGDTSDNLLGVPGIGAKTAARLLGLFGSATELYEALDAGRGAQVAEAAGARAAELLLAPGARENVTRNLRLMAMRADLPVPAPEGIRLPLEPGRIRRALTDCGILLGPSLWALTGGEPPEPDPAPVPFTPPVRRQRFSRVPGAGQLALF